MNILKLLLAALSTVVPCALSFSVEHYTVKTRTCVLGSQRQIVTSRHDAVNPSLYCAGSSSRALFRSSIHILRVTDDSDVNTDDGDGWGDEKIDVIASSSSDDRLSKSEELARLQNDMANKQNQVSSNYRGASNSPGPDNGERDLFIPIFTLVSVIGFGGLYGYEMLRLYSRGELYLPWEN